MGVCLVRKSCSLSATGDSDSDVGIRRVSHSNSMSTIERMWRTPRAEISWTRLEHASNGKSDSNHFKKYVRIHGLLGSTMM